MSIDDWLFREKLEKNAIREFAGMMEEFGSSPLPEGKVNTSTGETACPHCGNALPWTEALERRSTGAVGATDCPKCGETFKQH